VKKYFLAIVLLTIGCNEEPVGFDELGRGKEPLTPVTVFATDQGAYGDHIPLGGAEYLICGRDSIYEARMLLQFGLSDSIADSLDSLKLILYDKAELTDTLLDFSVYLITQSWNEYQATWQLANSVTRWIKPGGDYDSVAIAHGRFGPESTVVDLFEARTKLADNEHYGIMIIPDNEGFATAYSSYTSSKSPKLVFYQKKKSEQRLAPIQDSYFVDSRLGDIPEGRLWVGSGYGYRSYVRFDLDTLPALARITSAELVLWITNIVTPIETLQLAVHKLTDEWDGKYTDYDLLPAVTKQFTKKDTMVVFDIRGIVQAWANDSTSNYGLLITFWPEYNAISRLELGAASDSARRPRLRGSSIAPPKPRF
jgi:hypothetical protein